jgi:ribosome maturation factor RimP
MTAEAHRVRDTVTPVVRARGLELYDVELHPSLVRVIVDRPSDRPGGVGLDDLDETTRAVSRALDASDPIVRRYTLEVSSPGIERPLRTPDHFLRAVGETVKVKTTVDVDGSRRVQGVLVGADEAGITLRVEPAAAGDPGAEVLTLRYADIARARTVFDWDAGTAPSQPSRRKQKRESRS